MRLLATPSVMAAARRAAGISRKDAAALLGVDSAHLGAIEGGYSHTTVETGREMADLYEVPFAAFFLPRVPRWAFFLKRLYRWFPWMAANEA